MELICSPHINGSQIAILSTAIDEYLENRFTLFPDNRMKPKHHFLKHYPLLILIFGPLIRTWTIKFESKHSYFKKCVRYLHNFKSLCSTLSVRHQLKQAFRCSGAYFPPASIEANQTLPLHLDTYMPAIQEVLMEIGASPEDQVTSEVTYRGTTYKKVFYVPINCPEYNIIMFGEILLMIIRGNEDVYFLLRVCQSEYNSDLHLYQLHHDGHRNKYVCLKSDDLADYYPLPAYGRGNDLKIVLKHAVSCR